MQKNNIVKDLKLVKNYLTKKDKFLRNWDCYMNMVHGSFFLMMKNTPSIPPWEKLNAININTGKINWSKPIG